MRVLTVGNMYPPHHLGGYELVWRSCVEHLRGSGHEVRVLTTDYRNDVLDEEPSEGPDIHRELRWYWRDHRFPRFSPAARLALERHNLAVLGRHLDELQPEVVSWWAMGGMSMSLIEFVRRRGLPAVGAVHDDWLVYGPEVDGWQRLASRLGLARRLIERLSGVPTSVDLDSAAKWLFVSETMRRRAREAGLDPPGSGVASSGIDTRLFSERPEGEWVGRLLYVGRLDARKGVHVAIAALGHLAEATLEIVGDGDPDYRMQLESQVVRHDLQDRVRFSRCTRDELPDRYAAADALLFPVLWEEPWGLVPLEAMAVGTPVIATGAGGSGEYLRDGLNCLLYGPREDPRKLAEAIQALAGDRLLRHRLREGGFETAAKSSESRFNAELAAVLESAATTR